MPNQQCQSTDGTRLASLQWLQTGTFVAAAGTFYRPVDLTVTQPILSTPLVMRGFLDFLPDANQGKNSLDVILSSSINLLASEGTTKWCCFYNSPVHHTTTVLRPFFPGPRGWAGARRELLDFKVQGEINRGRHTNHPAGRHSIRTNQCPPPPSPTFLTGRMSFLPPNQQCQSTVGN